MAIKFLSFSAAFLGSFDFLWLHKLRVIVRSKSHHRDAEKKRLGHRKESIWKKFCV